MLMPNNFASTVNVATPTPDLGGVTFQSAPNVATSNYHTTLPQLNYHTFQSVANGGLMRGTSIFPPTNFTVPYSGTIPIRNQIISKQPFNVGSEGRNFQFDEYNFNNVHLQVICSSIFSYLNILFFH